MFRFSLRTAAAALLLLPVSSGCLATRSYLTEYEPYDAREDAAVAAIPPRSIDPGYPVPPPSPPRLMPVPGSGPLIPPPVPPSEEIPEPPGVGLPPSPNRSISWSKPSTWFRSIHFARGSKDSAETEP